MSEGDITLNVKLLTGKQIQIRINPSCTVAKLAQEIHEKGDIPVERINLVYEGKVIFPNHMDNTLNYFGIKNGTSVYSVLHFRQEEEDETDENNSNRGWPYRRKLIATIGILSSVVTLVLFVLLLLSILETNLVLLIFFTVFSIIFDVWFISWNCICFKCNGKWDSGVVEENKEYKKEYKNEEIIRPESKDIEDDIVS